MSAPNVRPLYVQIADLLVRDIAEGRLVEGDRLAPEREMAAGMGIAVGTLRKALARLEAQGMLERRQGSGNYVANTRAAGGLYGFFRLERIGGGGQPTAEVLAVDRVARPAGLPQIGTSPEVWRIRRLRRIGGVAAAVEEIWLDVARGALTADLPAALYHHYATALGLRIQQVEDAVSVGRAPSWAPASFGPGQGAVVGHVRRQARDQHGALAEVSDTWFDTDKVLYRNRAS